MLAQRSGPELTILGIVVTIRPAWAAAAVVALVLTAIEAAPDNAVNAAALAWYVNGLIVVAGLLGSILLHEAAHAAAGRRAGISTGRISVYPLGGAPDDFNLPGSPREETIIALAGPAASMVAGGVLFGLWGLFPPSLLRDDLLILAAGNVILGGVNLLPGYPLDGGRIFRALVWYLHDDFSAGTRAAVTYGQIISTFALASGLVVLGSRTNWSLIGIWIILAAWGVARVGRQEVTRSALVSIGASLTAGDAVRGLNPHVQADLSLDDVLEALLAEVGAGPALVMNGGEVLGVIALPNLRHFRRPQWPSTTAQQAMIPLPQLRSIDESAPVRRLLTELTRDSTDCIIVTGQSGVVGAIDRRIAIDRLVDRVEAARQSS